MNPLTSAELADLKAKAKAATPGPWEPRCALTPQDGEYDYAIGAEVEGKQRSIAEVFGRLGTNTRVDAYLTANFIAAAHPETFLRLIAMIKRRDEQIETIKKYLEARIEQLSPARNPYAGVAVAELGAVLKHLQALAATEQPK